MVDAGPTETEEILEGEVIGDGDGEEAGGPGARVREHGTSNGAEQVNNALSLVELGSRRSFLGGRRAFCCRCC